MIFRVREGTVLSGQEVVAVSNELRVSAGAQLMDIQPLAFGLRPHSHGAECDQSPG